MGSNALIGCSYVPGLGLFTADCDDSGHLFNQREVLRLLDEPSDARLTKLGLPWVTANADLPHRTLTEPDSVATHWDRRHSEVIVVGGKHCGADLIFTTPKDEAAVDAALTERGFLRVGDWTPLDETARLYPTDLYRLPSPCPFACSPAARTTDTPLPAGSACFRPSPGPGPFA